MNKFDYIYNKLKEKVDDNLLPGFSLLITKDGKEVYRAHCNYNGNEIFRMASMTKPMTAVAALKAQELGLININDSICKYIDGFDQMKIGKVESGKVSYLSDSMHQITIKDILRHQSGLGSGGVGDILYNNRKAPKTLKEAIDGYKNWYLDFEPESKSVYSGLTALDIVAYIIEITSKMPYFDFLTKYILKPLNMVDTTYKLNDKQKKRLAPMYTFYGENEDRKMGLWNLHTFAGFDGFEEGFPCGAAGLMSTLEDYSHFAIMLAGKGIYNGIKVLEEKSILLMQNDIIPLPCEGVCNEVNWGYAVFVRGTKASWQPLKTWTFGWSGAYSTHFFVNTFDNTSVTFMTNLSNDGGSGSPNIKILEKAYSEVEKQ